MNKLLSDTRIVAALVALVVVCLTVLAALGKVPGVDVIKMLGGFLSGVVIAWQRGSPAPAPEKKETPIPPVLPLLGICLAFLFLPGASCASAKPIIRTVNDIAADWCAAHYASLNGISVEDAVKTFCTGEKALKPWLDVVLAGQKSGVGKTECEVTITKDAPASDAGKD